MLQRTGGILEGSMGTEDTVAALRAPEKATALKIMVAKRALRSALKIPAALVALTVMAALRALMFTQGAHDHGSVAGA